jgi:hypothetical protein
LKNCGIEWHERDPDLNQGFLNWQPTHGQILHNPDVPAQSIFPHAFTARKEDGTSLLVENGQQFLTFPAAEAFIESNPSKPSMWITQSVGRVMYQQNFRERQIISSVFPARPEIWIVVLPGPAIARLYSFQLWAFD